MADNILHNPQFREAARQFEKREGLPEGSLLSQANIETRGNPNAVSVKGAQGLFQFMPATAKQYNVDVNNPWDSLRGAAEYLGDLNKQYKGNFKAALAHYNGGAYNAQYQVDGTVPSTDRVSPKNHEVNKRYVSDVLKGIPSFISSANAAEGPPDGTPVINPTAPKPTAPKPSAQPTDKLRTIAGLKILQAKQQGISDEDIVQGLAATAPPEIASVVKRNLEAGVTAGEIVQGMASKQLAQWEQDKKDADPTKSMTGLQKLGAGMGKAFVDTWEGAKHLKTWALGTDDELKKLQEKEVERQQLDKPLMDTGAGKVGYIAGVMAPTLATMGSGALLNGAARVPGLANAVAAARGAQVGVAGIPGLPTLSAAGRPAIALSEGIPLSPAVNAVGKILNPTTPWQMAASGAVQGALTPTTGDGQLATNIAVGGAFGGLGGKLLDSAANAIARPMGREVAQAAPELIKKAEQFNLPVSAANIAQQTDKGGLASWVAKRITNPTNQQVDAVQHAIANEVGKGVGVNGARTIDNDLLVSAKPFAQFDQMTQGKQIPLSQASLQRELSSALDTYAHNTIGTNREAVSKVNDLIGKAAPIEINGVRVNPSYSPQTLQKWRSEIGSDLAPDTVSPQAKALLGSAKDAITRRIENGLTKEEFDAYKLANKQWENKLALEEMIRRSNNLGTLTPAQMVQAVKGGSVGHKFAQGAAPYQDLATVVNQLYGKGGLVQRPSVHGVSMSELGLGTTAGVGGGLAADLLGGAGAVTASILAKRVAEAGLRKAVDSQRAGVRNALVGNTKFQKGVSKVADVSNPALSRALVQYMLSQQK